ncbi:MAG: hypothetical protein ACJ768_09545 [Gaiellaceae bacterium]
MMDAGGFLKRADSDVYAPDALLELRGLHRGAAEIRRALEGWLGEQSGEVVEIRRTLVSASDDSITDEWERMVDGQLESKGLEYWRFNPNGLVYEHRIYGHRAVQPGPGLRERVRMALAHPAAGFALLRRRRNS